MLFRSEIDTFIALGLLNRLEDNGWRAELASPAAYVTSTNGVTVQAQRPLEFANDADVVLFDSRRPEWQPLINPVANLVYSATGDSVKDVFVMGEQVVANGRLTKIDESKLYEEIPVAVSRFGGKLKLDKMVQLRWPVS